MMKKYKTFVQCNKKYNSLIIYGFAAAGGHIIEVVTHYFATANIRVVVYVLKVSSIRCIHITNYHIMYSFKYSDNLINAITFKTIIDTIVKYFNQGFKSFL